MRYWLFLFLIMALPAFAQTQGATELGIAAIVNDDIITSRDVDGRINLAIQGANIKPNPEMLKDFRHQATEALIDEQIRVQEARRLGLTPTKEEIDDAFAKLAAQNNASPEQFKAAIMRSPGVYESLRHQLLAQLSWTAVLKKKIRPQINVTETDINTYLAEKEKSPAKVEYEIAEIFLKKNDTNKKLADQIVSELKAGKRFSILARQFSQGLEASKGGMLGWIPEKTLEPALDQAIAQISVGDITPAIETERGLHILLLRDKRDVLPSAESSQRLSLKQAVVPLPPRGVPPEIEVQAKQQAKLLQADAKDCDAMDALIKKINMPISRDLGKVRLADLPPAAVSVVKDLPDGKASEPIRASDGYVVFMVCGRDANTADTMRDDVANIIGTERLKRLQNRYYRDLRAAAYVDIKQQ